jgi:hypothetical protein
VNFKETINNTAIAQSKIAEMVRYGTVVVEPCNGCNHATQIGCVKDSSTNSDQKELGPIYDISEGIAVCPIQKGELRVEKEIEVKDGHQNQKEIPLGPLNAWGRKK